MSQSSNAADVEHAVRSEPTPSSTDALICTSDDASPDSSSSVPHGIDGELAALRAMDQELSQQLVAAEQQLVEQGGLRRSITARIEELHDEVKEFTRQQNEARASMSAMRQEMKDWNEASAVYYDWLQSQNTLDDVLRREKALQDQVQNAPASVLKGRHRAHDALALMKRFIQQHVMPAVWTQLGSCGAAELRCTSRTVLETSIPMLLDNAAKREKLLHEFCSEADYRAEESMRLESTHKTIAEQCLTESVDVCDTKNDQLQKIENAFQEEKMALLRIKARLEAEAKEVEFHMKRGTLAKGSTKMTSADIRLHDKVTSQQDDLKLQLQSFEALRSEKLQLEREAEASLQRLIKAREDKARLKAHAKAKLDEMRRFHEQLEEERADWIQARKEMHELVVQQQTKIRASAVDAAHPSFS